MAYERLYYDKHYEDLLKQITDAITATTFRSRFAVDLEGPEVATGVRSVELIVSVVPDDTAEFKNGLLEFLFRADRVEVSQHLNECMREYQIEPKVPIVINVIEAARRGEWYNPNCSIVLPDDVVVKLRERIANTIDLTNGITGDSKTVANEACLWQPEPISITVDDRHYSKLALVFNHDKIDCYQTISGIKQGCCTLPRDIELIMLCINYHYNGQPVTKCLRNWYQDQRKEVTANG